MRAPYSPGRELATASMLGLLHDMWIVVHRWKRRIVLAFADQGSYSATNFLLTILYAAWLPLAVFGEYAIIWTVVLFIEAIQTSLFTDNLPAIVSRYGRCNKRRLDQAAFCIVLVYGVATSIFLLVGALGAAVWLNSYGMSILMLALANPLQRLFLYFRRLCYIRDRQDAAALGSVVYGLTLVSSAFILHKIGLLSVATAVLLLGLANGIAIIAIYAAGFPRFGSLRLGRALLVNVSWLVRQMWLSGRWLAGAAIGFWIANWGIFPIVAVMAGFESAGVLRALQNLYAPIILFNVALNIAVLPRVADKMIVSGGDYARQFAIYGNMAFTGVVVVYSALVLGGARTILPLVYHKPEIGAASHYLWPLAVAVILQSARQASSVALLAVGHTRIFFVARVAATAVFVLAAGILGQLIGIEGMLWANVISHAVGTAVMVPEALKIQGTSGGCPARDPRGGAA